MEALIIRIFTMTGRPRGREADHSKFHLSDFLFMIAVYLGDATPFSLTRHFDSSQAPGQRIH